MATINKHTLTEYIQYCFDLLIMDKKNLKTIKTIVYLCSTHFLKSIIKKTKPLFNSAGKIVINQFLFGFTLVQNSITMNEIENHLVNLYNIFNNKYLDKRVEYSLAAIKTEIINRDLHRVNVNDVTSPEQKIRDLFFNKLLQLSGHDDCSESTKSIVENSPFRTYFNNLFVRVQEEIDDHNSIAENTNFHNPYYFPELFDILSKQLYLLFLRSC